MEKYIDSLKLSAKKATEPAVSLLKRKFKQPKKPKLTAEEFLEKTKKKPAKQSIQRPKTVSSAEKKKLKLLEEQYKELKKKLKKEQESKFSKSETQIKIEKEEQKEAKEKQAEKLQELALALKTVSPASVSKTVRQPFTILNNDLEFKKLSKKEQDDVKAYLKQFPKDRQLDFVNLYTSLSLKDRKAFLSQASPSATAPKGAISVIPPPPGLGTGAGPAPSATTPVVPPPSGFTPPPSTPPPILLQPTPPNVQRLLDNVAHYKTLYFGTNKDKLDEEWDKELDIIIPILEQDPSREIDIAKVAEIQGELAARVDRPAPTAFIPPGVYASGQASLDADDEDAEELAQLAKQPSVIPQSAQQNIARTNAVAVSSGNQPTIIRQVTPAGTPIPGSPVPAPAPASAPAPAPVVVPVVAKKYDYSSISKNDIKDQIKRDYDKKRYNSEANKLFPGKTLASLNQKQSNELLVKLKEDDDLQASAEEEPQTQSAQVTQLVDTSLIPVSAQLAQIPEAPEVVITPTDVDTTVADASANVATPAPSNVTASGFASGLKKVKQMRGKKAHDKVVHIMAINNALHRGLNKVKKMHGGAMYNKVKSVLMRGGDVSSSASGQNKTPADNTYIMFSDLSEFVDSDFYKQYSSIITKYPPVKKIFNAVPAYKDYRIVVRSMGDTYHTIYTIDANEYNFNSIIKTLVNMGGVNQLDYGKSKMKQANIQSTADVRRSIRQFNRGIQRGYQEGYEKQAEEEDNSPFASIVKGFMIPVSAAKELL